MSIIYGASSSTVYENRYYIFACGDYWLRHHVGPWERILVHFTPPGPCCESSVVIIAEFPHWRMNNRKQRRLLGGLCYAIIRYSEDECIL